MADLAPKAVLALILDAPAGIGSTSFTVTRPFTVLNVNALCTGAAVGGTMTIKRGLNALTDAMVCAVSGDLSRCASLTLAERAFVASDLIVVTILVGAAAGSAIVTIQPTAITGGT
jgi:hypothetical protein